MDTRKKSLLKTITWRAIAIIGEFSVVLIFTKQLNTSLKIIIVGNIIAMILYYFHERMWVKFNH